MALISPADFPNLHFLVLDGNFYYFWFLTHIWFRIDLLIQLDAPYFIKNEKKKIMKVLQVFSCYTDG